MKYRKKDRDSSLSSSKISNDRSFEILKLLLGDLRSVMDGIKSKHDLTDEQILRLVRADEVSETIPASVFVDSRLRPLESVCKYLREEKRLEYNEIAAVLNRDYRTIWTTYNNSSKKVKGRLAIPPTKYELPLNIFQDRKLSVLEAVVSCLKDKFGLKFAEIAVVLRRDQRNVWSIYHKAKKKWKTS